jgi:predicted AlkP superfamily phosphohydrolase/phosphomutase
MITNPNLDLPIPPELRRGGIRKPRLLVVGFDAITFDLVDPLVQAGHLPNLSRLMANGVSSRMYCPPPTNSVAGWTLFATGTNVGKHGIYAFETMVPSTGEFVGTDARLRACAPFWKLLSEAGKKVVVINVPMTYPPDPINGVVISGMPVPPRAEVFTQPPELTSALRALGYSAPFGTLKNEQLLYDRLDELANLAGYLMREVDWDSFVVVFTDPDKIGHLFIGDKQLLSRVYIKLDSTLANLIASANDPTYVVVCSDHGLRETSRSFYLERWLYQEGLLVLKPDAELRQLVSWRTWQEKGVRGLAKYVKYRALKAVVMARRWLGLPSLGSDTYISEWLRWEERLMKYDPVDWTRTRVYRSRADGGKANNCGLRINQRWLERSLDPDGEYERLCTEVISRLERAIDTETDEPFVDRIYRREELYHGPMLHRLPDIIIKLRDEYMVPKYSWTDDNIRDPRFFETSAKYGCHHSDGVFILYGSGVKRNAKIKLELTDLAPLILYLMDVEIPSYMDGSVPVDAFNQEFLAARPVRIVQSDGDALSRAEFDFSCVSPLDAEIEAELIKLGYK